MATDDLGITFAPTAAMDKTKAVGDPNANVQEAIRTLSLHIPKVVGAKTVAPGPLLNGLGSQAIANPGVGIEQLIEQLFGPLMRMQQQAPGGAPLPPAGFGNGPTTMPPSAPPAPHIGIGQQPGVTQSAPVTQGSADVPSKFEIDPSRFPQSFGT